MEELLITLVMAKDKIKNFFRSNKDFPALLKEIPWSFIKYNLFNSKKTKVNHLKCFLIKNPNIEIGYFLTHSPFWESRIYHQQEGYIYCPEGKKSEILAITRDLSGSKINMFSLLSKTKLSHLENMFWFFYSRTPLRNFDFFEKEGFKVSSVNFIDNGIKKSYYTLKYNK